MPLFSRKFKLYGIPFITLVAGGSFGLQYFTSLRYEYRRTRRIRAEAEKQNVPMKNSSEVTLESEFKKIEDIDTSNWENKRGPRPWEDGNVLYQEALERGKKLKRAN